MLVRPTEQEVATTLDLLRFLHARGEKINFEKNSGRNADAHQTQDKMSNIANHQGNANQNHNEKSPHISQNKKNTNLKKLVRMRRKWSPLTLLVGM